MRQLLVGSSIGAGHQKDQAMIQFTLSAVSDSLQPHEP